ncbi:hypothetical protein M2459_001689 [Parabacteroides sp. PF5-5]|uniref:LVIVD repeat-containing protein n=1 Tax=unclassified Parabacteroides TaxID=2649774 RepID=UPI002472FB4A|nr:MULTISPECIES: hypothetical protein [unclassified Parabacteroides]MDH6304952.1 hypothetical protein [Parabacteroides sp. PH5-39]MDH6315962.1 hypothetical protein [Parabacteroides sp. PF5-13]MDH6319619.1 hypothetical protein [Parabacteroides sp. PH5-13]MDH6323350.1 hypothetical protein [Parabacteroides sp. PH5-8]MDH6327141.1 hypothetical protein [Parabacteroides sp. PH5-41]
MKTIYTSILALMAIAFISSCTDKYTEELNLNAPVYMSYSELRSSVNKTSPRDMVNPGKIYFKRNYLMVVEIFEGIHFIDISNPASPQNKAFLEIPGCIDIAVKDNSLYVDSYVDLVVVDVSDMNDIKVSGRVEDVLPYTLPRAEQDRLPYGKIDRKEGIVIDWKVVREKRELETERYPYYDDMVSSPSDNWSSGESSSGIGGGSIGKSGSMARFGIYDKYLYTATDYMLYLFNINNPAKPVKDGSMHLNSNIETMFIYDGHMFFGMPSGMMVYNLKVPSVPEFVGIYRHITSCDPVVIQDSIAYVTLRSGTTCEGTVNRLDVVEMSENYSKYNLLNSYTMTNPHGLGIDKNILFICDGDAGLKVYDAQDLDKIADNQLAHFPDIQTYDVIPVNGYLFMIGKGGFYLYDYSDIKNIKQIGHIPVVTN